jgi:hypothetical protein
VKEDIADSLDLGYVISHAHVLDEHDHADPKEYPLSDSVSEPAPAKKPWLATMQVANTHAPQGQRVSSHEAFQAACVRIPSRVTTLE